jgi:hypothetical protein
MDNAYLYGQDYDSVRSIQYEVPSAPTTHTHLSNHSVMMKLLVIIIVVVLVALGYFSLRFIPAFDITRVVFSVDGSFRGIPEESRATAQQLTGQSLFSSSVGTFRDQLKEIPIVKEVTLKRSLPGTLAVQLTIEEPDVFIAVADASDAIQQYYFLKNEVLVPLSPVDFQAYGNRVFVVEISPWYAEHLLRYRMDDGMQKAIALAAQMGTYESGRYQVISRITYDGNPEAPFGQMMLKMPAYHSVLAIREPVSEERLHDALRLITLKHANEPSRNIALIEQLRYDLYTQSLVSRN